MIIGQIRTLFNQWESAVCVGLPEATSPHAQKNTWTHIQTQVQRVNTYKGRLP